ncbi:hypothetical protein Y032_0017g3473 [Ancylostoma ceylanicum]|uniref:Uncharacterized protein n=1 Tax=Ancylostoma ceylanicum TaxID=53326 RepID=A0A016V5D7_9BILA|nr:hypothetical protein Y032_0017g3473 [Ancylostoma ceylanicum]
MTNLAVLLTPDLQTFFNDFSARIYSSDIPTSLFIPLTPPNGKLMIQHFDYLDPDWMAHCDEVLRRAEHFNERLRRRYGIEPEDDEDEDEDMRPRFLRTSDTSDETGSIVGRRGRSRRRRFLRVPYTPFPGKTDRATRDTARMILRNLANPHGSDEHKYRVTSTLSSIAGVGPAFNPIRLVRSDPQVSRASSIVCTADLVATRAASATSCLASNLISLTHTSFSNQSTSSSDSCFRQSARSSSAHSRLTPHNRRRNSPTLSDVVRFRNRIGILSDFLRNPRHRAPKPIVRSNSDASTQHGGGTSSDNEK